MDPNSAAKAIAPQRAHISHLLLRVPDVDRAAKFFGALFSWQFERSQLASHAEQRSIWGARTTVGSIRAVFVDDASAPPVRVEFDVENPELALARTLELGGSGDAASARDDQGVALAFSPRAGQVTPSAEGVQPGQIAVVIFDVVDTAKARAFHTGLFGRTYHQIGAGDRWWIDGQAVGIFGAPANGVRFWCVVPALEAATAEVARLGGQVIERGWMGPYQVCDCRDDQGTQFGLWYDANLRFA
ncbi:MAG TPA: VOC family protein [Polyangiaceae bacterium]|jgi:predicted enzyme related to lactoylglutathione lyase|nr:VOC family protein [Polyangiaceae bacterium]